MREMESADLIIGTWDFQSSETQPVLREAGWSLAWPLSLPPKGVLHPWEGIGSTVLIWTQFQSAQGEELPHISWCSGSLG